MRHRSARLACLVFGAVLVALPAATQAAPPTDVRGTYVVTSQVDDPSPDNTMVVDTEDCGTGTLAGHGFGNGYTWSLTGTIGDGQITYHADYHEISYSSDFAGTVSSDGNREAGTFHDSANGSGSFDFTRTKPGPSDGGCGRPSATMVACDTENPGQPNEDFRCTATVGDASTISPPVTPTGTVTFALDEGAGGTFASGPTCTLAPSSSGPTAFCAVTYEPGSQVVPTGSQPPLGATYGGDSTFTASSGRPQNGTGGPPTSEPTPEPTPDPTCAATPPPNRRALSGDGLSLVPRNIPGWSFGAGPATFSYCKGVHYTAEQKAAAKQILQSLATDTALRGSYAAGLGPAPGGGPDPAMKALFDGLVPILLANELRLKQDMQLVRSIGLRGRRPGHAR